MPSRAGQLCPPELPQLAQKRSCMIDLAVLIDALVLGHYPHLLFLFGLLIISTQGF
jgi:hypothetical protein